MFKLYLKNSLKISHFYFFLIKQEVKFEHKKKGDIMLKNPNRVLCVKGGGQN